MNIRIVNLATGLYNLSMIEYRFKPATTIGEGVENLYQILTYLRCPEGCPWDRKQTNKSVTACMLDEVYEYLDGVQKGSVESCREEIGDVMINVFMTQLIHSERNEFTPVEALNEVCEKLLRRHPHVFGELHAGNETDATLLWNSIKKDIEGQEDKPDDFFDHIPDSLPPMEEAYEIQKKLKKTGMDFSDTAQALMKVQEELSELEDAIADNDIDNQEEEVGDLLFAVINLSRHLGIRPNIAMRRCNNKIKTRFQSLFNLAAEKGITIDSTHLKDLYPLWQEIKRTERK